MARPKILQAPKLVTTKLERDLHEAALRRIANDRLGSFGEYVSRLIVADLRRKVSIAETTPRHLPKSRRAA